MYLLIYFVLMYLIDFVSVLTDVVIRVCCWFASKEFMVKKKRRVVYLFGSHFQQLGG